MNLFEMFPNQKADYAANLLRFDSIFNPEIVRFNEFQSDYYKQNFQQGSTPVFRTPAKEDASHLHTNKPQQEFLQSSGYRGLQSARKKAGLPYDKNAEKHRQQFIQSPDYPYYSSRYNTQLI